MQIAQVDRSRTAKCTSLFETSSRVIKHGQFGDKSLGYDVFMHFCDSDQDVTRMQQEKKTTTPKSNFKFMLMKIQKIEVLRFSKL